MHNHEIPATPAPKYSIIIPTHDNLSFLFQAVTSVFQYTKDFELIVVDSGSTDDTPAYLQSLVSAHHNVQIATFPENVSFAQSCNTGLRQAKGDHLILLNNDVILTENWAEQLVATIPLAEDEWDAQPIGMIGPVSNNAGGNQRIQTDPYDLDQLQPAAKEHHRTHKGQTRLAGFLSGMCLMITRPCFEDVGLLDERFKIGGVEDTEYCTRAQLKGWNLAIDNSTYVHHFGQQTLLTLGNTYPPIHRANQLSFMEKYYDDTPKKLITTFRVRDQPDFLRRSLARAAEFCDGIIILCDRCNRETLAVARKSSKLLEVMTVHQDWDLYRDRSMMMDCAKKHDADWIFALDADEFIEDAFTYDVAHQLMHPSNPTTLAYSFPFCTFFLGDTHYRSDGIFGDMRGLRMYRNLPKQHPRMVRHKKRTCLACPSLAPFNVVNLRYRIKHYGYHTQEVCDRKYRFYTDLDPNPDAGYIGPRGYAHLIDPNFSLIRWREKNDLALCMVVKNEELNLFSFLYRYAPYFDQIVIVDTGSSDNTPKVAQIFGAEVHRFKWCDDFAAARNYAKSMCSTSWIFTPDPDEEFDQRDIGTLFKMMEAPVHAWLFQVVNFQPDDSVFYSDNVRLLRNIPEIYWTHLSHENITDATRANKLIVQPAPFKIKHYGYMKTAEVQQQKAKAYGRMIVKELKKNPKEAICHFHLAFHHFEKGQETKGLQSLQKALNLQPDLFIASKELGLRHLTKAAEYFRKTADTIPPGHYFHEWAQRINHSIAQALNTPID